MWERLKQSDILQAKQELRQRVDETLRRHAEELKVLDGDLAEVQTLDRLVDAFADKFGTAPPEAIPEATPAKPGDAAPSGNTAAEKRASNVRRLEPPEPDTAGRPRTNFDAFARATAKSDRW
jgi:hypothetical protein